MQEQYIFIHNAILEAATCGDTHISANNLQKLSHRRLETVFLEPVEDGQYAYSAATMNAYI